MSDTVLQEDIAWEKTAERLWSIDFDNVLLARLDARDFKLYAGNSVIDVAGLNGHRCSRLLQKSRLTRACSRRATSRARPMRHSLGTLTESETRLHSAGENSVTEYLKHFPVLFFEDIVQTRCIPFIGAGFSKNALLPPGAAMPDWDQLGRQVANTLPDISIRRLSTRSQLTPTSTRVPSWSRRSCRHCSLM
jgi:hypothetical protein